MQPGIMLKEYEVTFTPACEIGFTNKDDAAAGQQNIT